MGIATTHEGSTRVHRVVIQDEFLAQAVYPDLVVGALVHVTGEIDYDGSGAFVSVPTGAAATSTSSARAPGSGPPGACQGGR